MKLSLGVKKMLELWLSTDRKENTAALLKRVCMPPFDRKRYLIVPEQFSHALERKLCAVGGDTISRHAEVLGFSRLAERVFALEGGVADTQTDAAGKLLLMSLAVDQVLPELKVFAAAAGKPEFLLLMLQTIEEFRSFCVTPADLRAAAARLEGVSALKAEEFALLMESHAAACRQAGQNPETRLNRLLETLEHSDFAAGAEFFFDGFLDFNGVQREIIAQLLAADAPVHVALCCGALDGHEQQFAAARETAGELLSLAARLGVPVRQDTLPSRQNRTLQAMRRSLFVGGQAGQSGDFLRCVTAADAESECRAAAGEILRLAEGGARWRDITVACADWAEYEPILRSVLRRAGIPAYFAGTEDLLHQSAVNCLMCALRAATGGMEQEEVLEYIKSGFAPITDDETDLLENYILLWNLSGVRLERPWDTNPRGLRAEADEQSAARLAELNCLRERAIMPLAELRRGLIQAKNVGEMTRSFYAFVEKTRWEELVCAEAQRLEQDGQLQRAQVFAQLPTLLCGLLEQMYGTVGASVRAPEDFFMLLRAALGQYRAGTIPASLDCVAVGALASMRRSDTPYLLLLGANEGAFPAAARTVSLLTDAERRMLLDCGIGLMPAALGRLDRELAVIDGVLSVPEDGLYCSAVCGGESYFFRRMASFLPHGAQPADETALTLRSRHAYLSELTEKHALPPAELQERAERIWQRCCYCYGALKPETVRALYGDTLRLSSTRIDRLASCSLAYFLQFGLRAARRETAALDAPLYGELVHYVLEHTVRQTMEEGGFAAVAPARVCELSEEAMQRYARERLAPILRDEREAFLFYRSFGEVRQVVQELYEELCSGSFEPHWMELHFAAGEALPAVEIRGQSVRAYLEGYVDRVDLWRDGERLYVRVVDYKTGKKNFDYAGILHGLGLQMLLYLFALVRSGARLTGARLLPAGVEYFPARVEPIRLDNRTDDALLAEKREKNRTREGLVLKDGRVLQAMEHCEGIPRYLPYTVDREGNLKGDLADTAQLKLLERHVFSTVARLADRLYEGCTDRDPYFLDRTHNACAFCDFAPLCGEVQSGRYLRKTEGGEFWDELRGRYDG